MSKNLLHSHFLTAKFTKLWGLIAQGCWLYASFSTLIYARYLAWPFMAHIIVFYVICCHFSSKDQCCKGDKNNLFFIWITVKVNLNTKMTRFWCISLFDFFYVEWENQVKSICKKIFRRFFRLFWLIVNFSEKTICS